MIPVPLVAGNMGGMSDTGDLHITVGMCDTGDMCETDATVTRVE